MRLSESPERADSMGAAAGPSGLHGPHAQPAPAQCGARALRAIKGSGRCARRPRMRGCRQERRCRLHDRERPDRAFARATRIVAGRQPRAIRSAPPTSPASRRAVVAASVAAVAPPPRAPTGSSRRGLAAMADRSPMLVAQVTASTTSSSYIIMAWVRVRQRHGGPWLGADVGPAAPPSWKWQVARPQPIR